MAVHQRSFEQIRLPWEDGYDYGIGVDLLTGSPMALAVEGRSRARGQKIVQLEVSRIQRSSDLEKLLGLDFSLEAAALLSASVEARMKFVDDVTVETDSLFVVIRLEIRQAVRSIARPRLSEEAKRVAAEHPDRFPDQFGTGFIRGIRSGGLFVGVLRIDTETTEESREVAADLQAALTGGVASAKAKERFRRLRTEYEGKLNVKLFVVGDVPGLEIASAGDPEELLKNAQRLLDAFDEPDKAEHAQADYEVTLAPYEIVGPEVPRPEASVLTALDIIRECVQDRSTLRDNVSTLRLIVERPERFNFSNGARLDEIKAAVERGQRDIELLTECAQHAARDPATALPPQDYAESKDRQFPEFQMPSLLPAGIAPGETVVPDFSDCEEWGDVRDLAAEHHLLADEDVLREKARKFAVRGQRPPSETVVPEGTHVVVTTVRWQPDRVWGHPIHFDAHPL